MQIDDAEYIDCIKARDELVKLATELYNVEKEQANKSKVKAKQKPTITHWSARGAHNMVSWILKNHPILIKIGKNPKIYEGMNTKIYGK